MADLNIAILIAAKDQGATGVIGKITGGLKGLAGTASSAVSGGLKGLQTAVGIGLSGAVGLGVTAIGLIGGAAFGVAQDVQAANNVMVSEFGATADEAEHLAEIATSVWGDNFAGSIEEAAGAVGLARQQLGELADDELQRAAENAYRLQDVFGDEVPESMATVNTLMEEFGLTSDQAFDFVAAGYQKGLNANGDFVDSIGEYSNLFADAGFDADEFFSIMQTGAAGGVLGTDKIADAVKEMQIRLNEGGADVSAAFQQIGLDFNQIAASVAAGDESWAEYFPNIIDGLNSIEDPLLKNQAQVAIFGTQAEDLGVNFTEGLSTATTSLEDMEGAVGSLDAKYNDLGSAAEGYKRRFTLAFQPIGNVLLGLANSLLPHVETAFSFIEANIVPAVETLANVFQGFINNLSEGMSPLDAFIEAIWDIAPPEVLDFLVQLRDDILPGLSEWFTTNVQPIIDVVTQFVSWQDVLIGLGVVVASIVLPVLASIVVAAAPVIAVGAALIGAIALLRHAWETDFAGIRDFVAGIWDAITTAWDAFKALFSGDWQTFLTTMGDAWSTAWDAIVTFLDNLWTLVQPKLSAWWDAIVQWFTETDWIGLAQTAMDFIVTKLEEFWTLAKPVLEGWWTAINEWWDNIDWYDLAFRAITWILDTAANFWTRAKPVLDGWWTSLKAWWDGIDWGGLGTSLIDGIVSGLSGLSGRIGDKLAEIAQGAMDAWNAWWGNHSPSTVMIASVRDDIGGGVIRGFDYMRRDVAAIVPGVAASVFAPFAVPALAAAGGASRPSGSVGLVSSGGGDTHLHFDLRGTSYSRNELKALVKQCLKESGLEADRRQRSGRF